MWERITWKFNLKTYHLKFERNAWEFLTLCLISFILPSDKTQHIVPQVMHYYIVQIYKTTKSLAVLFGGNIIIVE